MEKGVMSRLDRSVLGEGAFERDVAPSEDTSRDARRAARARESTLERA